MIKLKFLTILLLFNLSLVSNLHAREEEKTAIVMGRITNVDNKPIAKLTVSIEDNFDFTDVDGRYRIKDVPYGRRTMKIMKEGMNLKEVKIEVNQPHIERNVDVNPVEPLIAILKDKDKDEVLVVRRKAAEALAKIGEPAVGPLIAALKDEDWVVRGLAAKALGNIKDPRAVEPLITTLKDKNWCVRDNAAEALEEITDQDFRKDQVKWQEWWEENKGKFRMGKGEEVKR